MENFYLSALIEEIKPKLTGRKLSRIAISANSLSELILDFRLPEGRILKASFEPVVSALYLDSQSKREDNKAHLFAATVSKSLIGLRLVAINKPSLERVVQLDFAADRANPEKPQARLFLSLTGRSANAYLTDTTNRIEAMLKKRKEFDVGDIFQFDNSSMNLEELLNSLSDDNIEQKILDTSQLQTLLSNSQIRQEFQARSSLLSEKQALESLILDLTKPKPHPVIYSSTNLATIKEDLHHAKPMVILSHIPLLFYREQKDFYIYTYESLSDAASRFYNYKSVLD